MAAAADFKVILTIDSQGNAKIEEVKRGLEGVGTAAKTANQEGAASAAEFAVALVRQLGIYALLAAGVYKLEQAVVGGFKAGIQAVDEFRLTTIGVAATITDMAVDQSKGQENYSRALAYSKDMYGELELAAARYFASGKEMVQAWNILAQKGIVLRKEEIDSLGIIVDRIKLSTQGQVSSLQIAQEMRSMITGQARATDQVGMLLKDRIPNLEAELRKHREIGDVVNWLASQFKGLAFASIDIQDTLESQKSTLGTLLTQVGRGGLQTAYEDIVGWLKQANDYLTKHRSEIEGGIARGWTAVKDLVGGVYGFIKDIYKIVSTPIVWTIKIVTSIIGPAAKFLAEGAGPGGDYGFGATTPGFEPTLEYKIRENQIRAEQAARYKRETFGMYAKDLGVAPVRPVRPDEGGGGAAQGAANQMLSLVDRLKQDIARLSEGSIAAIDAWYVKTVDDINKLVAKGVDGSEAMAAAELAAALKKEKATEDFYSAMAKEAGDAYMAIDLWQEKSLKNWQGVKDKITKQPIDVSAWVQQATDKKYYEQSLKDWEKMTSLQEKYFSGMAAVSPVLGEQLGLERAALELQSQIARAKLEDLIYHEKLNDQWRISRGLAALMTPEMEGQLRYLESQTQEMKLQAQMRKEWATQGISGWSQAWAFDRTSGMAKRGMEEFKSMMERSESWLGDTLGRGVVNAFLNKKEDLIKIWKDIFTSAIQWLMKRQLAETIDWLLPKQEKGGIPSISMAKLPDFTKGMEKEFKLLGKNLSLMERDMRSFGREIGDFGKATDKMLGGYSKVFEEYGGTLPKFETSVEGMGSAGQSVQAGGVATQEGGLKGQMAAAANVTAAGGLILAGLGVLTGSKELVIAGTALSMAALALQIAAAVGIFHSGGVVAHEGMILTAHGGLNLDERIVRAQVGEGIIKRDTMSLYQSRGISFADLNEGRLPVLTAPSGGGGNIVIKVGDININTPYKVTRRTIRDEVMPEIKTQLKRFGLALR